MGAETRYAQKLGMQPADEQLALIGEAGVFWMRLGRLKEALRVFDGLDAMAPQDACGMMGAAEVLLRLGRFREAESAAEKGLSRAHVSAHAGRYLYLLLGEARFALGRFGDARSAWNTAIRLAPDSPEADVARRFSAGAEFLERDSSGERE